jgi:hypothetical protein
MLTQTEKVVKIEKDETTQLADNLIREYKKTRWVSNSEKLGKPDSLSAWFSIKEMEDFIREAKENGGDGIKFYYGSFPENYNDIPLYAGRQTIVPVATRSRDTRTGGISNKDIYIIKDGEAKIITSGVPKLCPPLCASGSEGGMADLGITILDKGDKGMMIV